MTCSAWGSCCQAAAKTFGCYRTILLCSHGFPCSCLPCCCFQGSQAASFSHQGPRYQVEARATVIFFDIAAFEADGALRRRSSSLASVDHPNRPLTREHGGLMRWPENFYRPREQRKPNCEGTCRPANSLSARAMQQSIFGSMVLQWPLQQPHMTMFTASCYSREIVFSLQIKLY
ncbi:hypothetical protein BDE02_07G094000 [Populus trichocarpa]|nr:hypothetical protein BDE02_07G094000 [Populus trichocarpa]KAI5582563.1 hypothetical protein BDE02_07G094000 [Populus trichocarpa]